MVFDGKRFVIGIDLGTTNSAVSFVDLLDETQKKPAIKIFDVPQLTGLGEFSRRSVLPSFLYIPGEYDIAQEAITIPWQNEVSHFAGTLARDHGAKVPARLVSSAKSWLCHGNVDRRAKILPWGSGDDVQKVSPVEATSAYLNHIKNAWNDSKGKEDDLYLENQLIIITVPASFDEVARDLTVEAANMAGLHQVTLLEEPLAAFYSWLIYHENTWQEAVQPNELILVCDVGGGTTDFTLISLNAVDDGSPRFERIAVGDHLILGGDNIDLALASHIEISAGKKQLSLNQDKWKTLCHQCRQAKENILNHKSDTENVTIMGAGSQLIAGTISAKLERTALEKIVLDGFFPFVGKDTGKEHTLRKGITEFGLPFEPEPAITKHLGWFLERHKADVETLLGKKPKPDLVLFNGGSLKSTVIQERIRGAVRHWFREEDAAIPRVLENPNPDLAVALGAAYYGLVKTGKGVRVGSGSPRGYYLGVSSDDDGVNHKKQAVCLVERGLDEGSHISLKEKEFKVLANQPVNFDIFSSSFRSGDKQGDLIDVDDTLTCLPPIQTVVQFGKKGVKTAIPVNIEADYTEIGTLSLWCCSTVSSHRWQLQFQLRNIETFSEVSDTEIFEASLVDLALTETTRAFSDKTDINSLAGLPKAISGIVERPKESWPLSFIRSLSDELIKLKKSRRFTPEHEARWLNLMGFCMRPGFGDGFDEQRIKSLWKIYTKGVVHEKNAQAASEWWILWRRIAGGLTPGQQRQFAQDLTPVLMPKKFVKVKLPPQQYLEAWMAMANMEKLHVNDKVKWGRHLLMELKPKKTKPQFFWSLSRLGARELLYGPADRVISPDEITEWVKILMDTEWKNPKPVGTAIVQMVRKTGDRARDLDDKFLEEVVSWLGRQALSKTQIRPVQEIVPIERQEENTMFGDVLPGGLILHQYC